MANIVDIEGYRPDSSYFCWGYLEDFDTLYLGSVHHAAIIAELVNQGVTWDQLLNTRQMWGWGDSYENDKYINISFSSDEATQSKGVKSKVKAALQQAYPGFKINMEKGYGYGTSDNYGDRAKTQYLGVPLLEIGQKVIASEWDWGTNQRINREGTVVEYGDQYGEIAYGVQFPDGTLELYHYHDLQKVGNVHTAGSYSKPAFISEDGFKIFDARHSSGRDVLNHGYWGLCFGAIDKEIYLGDQHHAKIIYNLVDSGAYTYETLMAARQKWGWIRRDDSNNLEVSFTTDEALQTQDRAYSESVVNAIGAYFNRHAYIDEAIGEGTSNADSYGERSKQQYFGESPDEQYCDHCDQWYDPDEEYHDHDITYCDTCEEYYDANDPYQADEHDHVTVSYNISNPTTQSWIQAAAEHGRELNAERADYDPDWVDESDLEVWLVSDHNFDRDSAEWVAEKAMELIRSKPNTPDWMPSGLHMLPTQKVLPTNMTPPIPPPQKGERYSVGWKKPATVIYYDPATKYVYLTADGSGERLTFSLKQFQYYVGTGNFKKISMIRVTDLRDAEVFAKISADYIKLGAEGDNITQTQTTQTPIEIGSQWVDDEGRKHTVTSVEDGRVYYDFGNGYGDMSENIWRFYMTPITQIAGGQDQGFNANPSSQEQQITIDPQVEGAMKDDPQLLAIERNPESKEWRWSMDDNQLHIWRVLNRWQYGPSHYDMFGSEGYKDHSQGRVYVSPDGKVGVLYWQISHPNCEQTLNDWVQKTFGKQPDYVYRAYGPYKGFKTPRYYFPIVEVSGLPISPGSRWWERGELPQSYYYDHGMVPPSTKKKNYPAPKQKRVVVPLEDMRAEDFNPKKQKRRRRRQRKNQYRNRSRR